MLINFIPRKDFTLLSLNRRMRALSFILCVLVFAVLSPPPVESSSGGSEETSVFNRKHGYGVMRGHLKENCPAGTQINPSYVGDAYYEKKPDMESTDAVTYEDTLPCLLCPPGSFAENHGSKKCILCPPGTFTDRLGSTACQKCRPHTFNPFPGQILCKICSGGTVQQNGTYCDRKSTP